MRRYEKLPTSYEDRLVEARCDRCNAPLPKRSPTAVAPSVVESAFLPSFDGMLCPLSGVFEALRGRPELCRLCWRDLEELASTKVLRGHGLAGAPRG